MIKREKGFTLIELLIVIVIIGILAGVLIAVIDPEGSQNKARDAGIKATMNKTALVAEGFISAYNRTPYGDEFFESLATSATAVNCSANAKTCTFTISGNPLPDMCGADNYTSINGKNSTSPCYYYYDGTSGTHSFTISAASYGLKDTNFVYDNSTGVIGEVAN